MKNACKRTISKVFFECHWTQPGLFIQNFREGLMALFNRRDKRGLKHCFLSYPSLKAVPSTLCHAHVLWGGEKKYKINMTYPVKRK